jgi:hypothetical protein
MKIDRILVKRQVLRHFVYVLIAAVGSIALARSFGLSEGLRHSHYIFSIASLCLIREIPVSRLNLYVAVITMLIPSITLSFFILNDSAFTFGTGLLTLIVFVAAFIYLQSYLRRLGDQSRGEEDSESGQLDSR